MWLKLLLIVFNNSVGLSPEEWSLDWVHMGISQEELWNEAVQILIYFFFFLKNLILTSWDNITFKIKVNNKWLDQNAQRSYMDDIIKIISFHIVLFDTSLISPYSSPLCGLLSTVAWVFDYFFVFHYPAPLTLFALHQEHYSAMINCGIGNMRGGSCASWNTTYLLFGTQEKYLLDHIYFFSSFFLVCLLFNIWDEP